jgi:RNA polymerase sigma-70 factor, ECF subfamily
MSSEFVAEGSSRVEAESPFSVPLLDSASAQWLRGLAGDERDTAVQRLHELLVRAARREVHRRSMDGRVTGPELDDLAFQAAADALVAVLAKVHQFRGESRFTTWAYKFVILEVSVKLTRHFWRRLDAPEAPVDLDRLADRFGLRADEQCEGRDLLEALVRAMDTTLTERQYHVFVAIVIDGVPLDVLTEQVGGTRNSIYKMLSDARRKLRAALMAGGYLAHDQQQT